MRTSQAIVGVLLLAGSTARGDVSAAWKKYKGQIIVSDKEIKANYDSDKEMISALKKAHKPTLTRPAGSETWAVYFIGFMNKKPGASKVSLVFYESGKHEYVSAKEITIDPGSNIVMADVEVSEDDGLKKGGHYDVVLGRKVGSHETVFARTKLTFK
jgi:predicted SnoaL-like aldol condensation-catalyzing enzyme